MLLEGLEEKVVFNLETLIELWVNLNYIVLVVFDAVINIVDDAGCKLECYRVKFVVTNEYKNVIILNVNFKMIPIGNATKGIAKNTARVVQFTVTVEFIEVSFPYIAKFAMFGVDEDSWPPFTFDLNITGLFLVTC